MYQNHIFNPVYSVVYAIVAKNFVFLAKILKTFIHGLSGCDGKSVDYFFL